MSSDQAPTEASEENQLLRSSNDHDTQSSGTGTANLPEFPIEDVLRNWANNDRVRDILGTVYATHGDWEGWVLFEIEISFRRAFSIRKKQNVREVPVYKNAEQVADLVLKADKNHRGLIIEVICEDQFANRGSLIKSGIRGEMDKISELKEEYKGYNFKVFALVYSKAAETAVRALGFTAMPGIEVDAACEAEELAEYVPDEQPGTLRLFQKRIDSGSAGDGVYEVAGSLGGPSSGDEAADDMKGASSNDAGASGTS